MTIVEILDRLVSLYSVVGTPNGEIVGWISDYLRSHGVKVSLVPGPEGDRANLFATVGPADKAGFILSGHMDVVPAGEPGWTSNPFKLRVQGERLYGRGTADMKGFLAAALAAVPALAKMRLSRPIHLAFSYDEEAGARGVQHLIARLPHLCAKPSAAIVGEPSNMQGIRGHKGKVAARAIVKGTAGHSSRPDLGVNAIHAMAEVLNAVIRQAERLTEGPFNPAFEPPYSSLQAGVVSGGQAINIIPDRCVIEVEARAVYGVDPAGLLAPVKAAVDRLRAKGIEAEWAQMSAYPALLLPEDAPLASLVRDLTGKEPLPAVSYGTEAGLYQGAGIDAIICGPGDIGHAHKPDEFILAGDLVACRRMIETLGERCIG
jgi:acetylornithine deacetylase